MIRTNRFPALRAILIASAMLLAFRAHPAIPEYSVQNGTVRIDGVSSANPIIYDND